MVRIRIRRSEIVLRIRIRERGKFIRTRIRDISARMNSILTNKTYSWPAEAVESAVVLEQIAAMALGTITINPNQKAISQALLDKHYLRKHGKEAYYGQK